MNKNYHRTESGKGTIRKENNSRADFPSQNLPVNHFKADKELIPVDPRITQRYSFDDNGGGYKGL